MYARSTTIHAHPSFIDVGIVHIRDTVMPALAGIEGCAGLSLLVDHGSGRCIATSSWMDEDSLRASEGQVSQLRDAAAGVFHATMTVAQWEIAVVHREHRSHRGAGVRVTWLEFEPGDQDRAVDVYKSESVSAMAELSGFCSASLLVDPAAGRAVSSVTFDTAQAMSGSRDKSETIRTSGIRQSGARLLEVAEFELAIAHLHVPEMA